MLAEGGAYSCRRRMVTHFHACITATVCGLTKGPAPTERRTSPRLEQASKIMQAGWRAQCFCSFCASTGSFSRSAQSAYYTSFQTHMFLFLCCSWTPYIIVGAFGHVWIKVFGSTYLRVLCTCVHVRVCVRAFASWPPAFTRKVLS